LLFLVTGLGGGTGGGAAPGIAQAASRAGAMVIAFAAMPFTYEGTRRTDLAKVALSQLRFRCEAVIPVYNDLLLPRAGEAATAFDALSIANGWMERGIAALCAMLFKPGLPNNIDFALLRSFFPVRDGKTLFVFGAASGSGTDGTDSLQQALKNLLGSPLAQRREVNSVASLIVTVRGWPAPIFSRVNGVVDKIAEEFGGRERRLQSIIPDPSCGDSVEICVLGSVGGVHLRAQELTLPAPSEAAKAEGTDTVVEDVSKDVGGAVQWVFPGAGGRRGDVPPGQSEMTLQQHDFFEKMKGDSIEGQDLDVPTFLRRGIKISL
jgi:cell division protein FtsZ